MKDAFKMLICVGSCMFLLPIFIVYLTHTPVGVSHQETSQIEERQEEKDIINEETLIGILAKEVPYTYELEALKAQAVVERTYMARRILGIQKQGAIVGYTEEEMKALWGEENYQRIYNKYKEAVEATRGKIIVYNNQPIEALYHKSSSGRTRDGKSVYKQEIPYLKSVESSVDVITEQIKWNKEEMVLKIKEKYPDLVAEVEHLESQIQIVSKDQAGYVDAIQIGNITLTGEALKIMLGLPSCAFKIYNAEEVLIFDVKGSGTGIGLSQNGANELAKQGMLYEDIIKHYYTGISIEDYEVQ